MRSFATIARARDAARQKPGPHTILLAPGRYFHDAPIAVLYSGDQTPALDMAPLAHEAADLHAWGAKK